jgi:hypothetical protein
MTEPEASGGLRGVVAPGQQSNPATEILEGAS